MSLAQPLPPHDAEESTQTLLDTPEKEKQLPQLPLPHSGFNLKSALEIALVLILATSYLTFCVIAHYRNIPIGSNGVVNLYFFHCEQYLCCANNAADLIPGVFSVSIASGITTIAILIIYVALWPIKALVDEIRVRLTVHFLSTQALSNPSFLVV
jgi:hypothetical protein